MKWLYLVIIFSQILFIGCSSTYRISDFSSKEKFYEEFNKSTEDESLNVILANDSAFTIDNGAKIVNDSLVIYNVKTVELVISLDEIQAIENSSKNVPYKIILKNGDSIQIKGIKILANSKADILTVEDLNRPRVLSLNNIKEISYKDHWQGVTIPSILGVVVGFGVGIIIIASSPFSNTYSPPVIAIIVSSVALGLVGGGILGWLDGYTYTYEFNP
jgi:hypothetical protein